MNKEISREDKNRIRAMLQAAGKLTQENIDGALSAFLSQGFAGVTAVIEEPIQSAEADATFTMFAQGVEQRRTSGSGRLTFKNY